MSRPEFSLASFRHETLPINGLEMHVARHGFGAPIICLHGFPDLWCGWARVAHALGDDWEFILPDQRGYNLTTRSSNADDYRPDLLIADIAALITAISTAPVTLAGHDWGGVVAAWLASLRPDLVRKLILVNAAHPVALQHSIWEDPAQAKASAYFEHIRTGAFEAGLTGNGAEALIDAWLTPHVTAGRMNEAEAALYCGSWRMPSAWRAMTDWYRAAPFVLQRRESAEDWTAGGPGPIAAQTLIVWGEADAVFTMDTLDRTRGFAPNAHIHRLSGIGHNPLREAPHEVAAAIKTFLMKDNAT